MLGIEILAQRYASDSVILDVGVDALVSTKQKRWFSFLNSGVFLMQLYSVLGRLHVIRTFGVPNIIVRIYFHAYNWISLGTIRIGGQFAVSCSSERL
jgi:hypothetical protein